LYTKIANSNIFFVLIDSIKRSDEVVVYFEVFGAAYKIIPLYNPSFCGTITIRNKMDGFIRGNYMNKKIIISIVALFCANVVSAMPIRVQPPFQTCVEQSVYQNLVNKFKFNELTLIDNTVQNIDLLKSRESYLIQTIEGNNKSSLWPYWLAASFYPTVRGLYTVGHALKSLSWTNFIWHIGNALEKPMSWPFDINQFFIKNIVPYKISNKK
jgi:hypothetical protein